MWHLALFSVLHGMSCHVTTPPSHHWMAPPKSETKQFRKITNAAQASPSTGLPLLLCIFSLKCSHTQHPAHWTSQILAQATFGVPFYIHLASYVLISDCKQTVNGVILSKFSFILFNFKLHFCNCTSENFLKQFHLVNMVNECTLLSYSTLEVPEVRLLHLVFDNCLEINILQCW